MEKIARNAPCPCGSGKKYKHCCLTTEQTMSHLAGHGEDASPVPEGEDQSPVEPHGGRYRFEPGSYGGPGHRYHASIACLKWDPESESERYHFVLVKADEGVLEEDVASAMATAHLDQAFRSAGGDAETIAAALREAGYALVSDFRVIGE